MNTIPFPRTANAAFEYYKLFKRLYYRHGLPIISDHEYDTFELECRTRWPEDDRFHIVGDIYDE